MYIGSKKDVSWSESTGYPPKVHQSRAYTTYTPTAGMERAAVPSSIIVGHIENQNLGQADSQQPSEVARSRPRQRSRGPCSELRKKNQPLPPIFGLALNNSYSAVRQTSIQSDTRRPKLCPGRLSSHGSAAAHLLSKSSQSWSPKMVINTSNLPPRRKKLRIGNPPKFERRPASWPR